MPDLNLKNGLWTRQQIADHTGFNRNTLKSEFVKRDIFPTETGGTDTKPIDYYTVKQWGPVVYGGVHSSDDVEMSLKSKDDLLKEKTFEEVRRLSRENDRDDKLLGKRIDFIRAGQPIITQLSNDLDRVGEIANECGAELDPKKVEDVNQHFVKYKNRLANLADTLLTTGTG